MNLRTLLRLFRRRPCDVCARGVPPGTKFCSHCEREVRGA